jgi:hypothetical protein
MPIAARSWIRQQRTSGLCSWLEVTEFGCDNSREGLQATQGPNSFVGSSVNRAFFARRAHVLTRSSYAIDRFSFFLAPTNDIMAMT